MLSKTKPILIKGAPGDIIRLALLQIDLHPASEVYNEFRNKPVVWLWPMLSA